MRSQIEHVSNCLRYLLCLYSEANAGATPSPDGSLQQASKMQCDEMGLGLVGVCVRGLAGFGWSVSDIHSFAGSRLLQTTQRHDRRRQLLMSMLHPGCPSLALYSTASSTEYTVDERVVQHRVAQPETAST